MLFAANDGLHGDELWATDGTTAGTAMLVDLELFWNQGSGPRELSRCGRYVVFSAIVGNDLELWRTDGTAAGTVQVFDDPAGSQYPAGLVSVGDRAFYVAPEVAGVRPWVTDGTTAGTMRLADIEVLGWLQPPSFDRVGDNHVVFQAMTQDLGWEPWISDGTVAGTRLLVDGVPGPGSSAPTNFGRIGDRLIWSGWDEAVGREPWAAPLRPFGIAFADPIGAGCGTLAELRGIGTARPGSAFAVGVSSAPPRSPMFVWLGHGRLDVQIGNGCTLLTDTIGPWFSGLTDGQGATTWPLPIPPDPRLVGERFHMQGACALPGGPLAGIAGLTRGLAVMIGR